MRATELLGLLPQTQGGDLEQGGASILMMGSHADMRVVAWLQVHGRDVTNFAVASVLKNKKTRNRVENLILNH